MSTGAVFVHTGYSHLLVVTTVVPNMSSFIEQKCSSEPSGAHVNLSLVRQRPEGGCRFEANLGHSPGFTQGHSCLKFLFLAHVFGVHSRR